jgi:putative membrane-bound dehydrogenase-like protein
MPARRIRISDRDFRHCVRGAALALAAAACGFAQNTAKPQAAGVKVPPGFEATLYADDHLAHDIYAMTIDAKGRVVVAGRGYVRILIDKDGDGKADSYKQFADGPKNGAQGLYFHGSDLICVGDAGLIRYRDRDGDDRADGKPDVFLRIRTGGEHHAHAIRKGPDGWSYLIAGNMAGVTAKFATLPTSPIREPEGGAILRLKPDLSGGEILADGFRNPYDFAFNAQGDVFVYDSDGERAVSLPWYRPTRVFHALPGSHAGWVTRSWKRPRTHSDMPPVVGAFGRGSPTGVACYRHRQFPKQYFNAVFALDWTFGRVLAMPLERNGSTWQSKPVTFMTGVGEFGFAPTDVAVGPDGSLFVSVGGRGTRGGVFRVRYVGKVAALPVRFKSKLDECLLAPQPLSSWSRAKWEPLAKSLGKGALESAVLDEARSDETRMRAIEIQTELAGGLDPVMVTKLAASRSPEVRARAIWSYGRANAAKPDVEILKPYLVDSAHAVRRAALNALLGAGANTDWAALVPLLAKRLGDSDRYVRLTAMHVVARMPQSAVPALRKESRIVSAAAALALEIGRLERRHAVDVDAFSVGMLVLERLKSPANKRDAVRLMQLALGDLGPRKGRPPVYDSCASRLDLTPFERRLDPFRARIAKVYPTGIAEVDYELARVIAMLAPYNAELLSKVLAKITDDSHPIDDIHHLIVASRIPAERNAKQSAAIARGLVRLDEKIRARKLKQDLHWDDRIREMVKAHAQIDADLALMIVKQPGFGRPGHVIFLETLPEKHWQAAVEAFVKRIRSNTDYRWTTDIVFLLGDSPRDAHRDLVRKQFSNFALRDAVLLVLAKNPAVADRPLFVRGLESGQLDVISACLAALEKFPAEKSAGEQIALFKSALRLGRDKNEIPVRDRLIKRLRKNTGQQFGYKFAGDPKSRPSAAMSRWEDWLKTTHPDQASKLSAGGESWEQFKSVLAKVDWSAGNVARGRELFHKRSCAQCHGSRRALGPDLAGVARRFSRDDFFLAIVQPSRDVSPRYQTTQIVTARGKTYVGMAIYQSVDGVTLRTGTNQTLRIEAADIEDRRQLNTSLMPVGLLKGLKPEELADLYAYVRSLGQ